MAVYRNLDIIVVYSDEGATASKVRGRPAAVGVDKRRLLGAVTLLVAAAWLYATWFPVSHFLRTSILNASLGLVDVSQLFGFKPPPADLANPSQPQAGSPDEAMLELDETPPTPAFRSDAEAPPAAPAAKQRAESEAAVGRLTMLQYAWVAAMSLVACVLAMAGAAGLCGWLAGTPTARAMHLLALAALGAIALMTWKYWPGPGEIGKLPESYQSLYTVAFAVLAGAICAGAPRATARYGLVAGLLGLGLFAGLLWKSYPGGWGLPVFAWQTLACGCWVIAALLGAVLAARARGLTALAITLMFLSCVATVAGLWYGQRHEAFGTFTPRASTYAWAILLQSAFAWILLFSRRWVR
jgi:hypothetical protein